MKHHHRAPDKVELLYENFPVGIDGMFARLDLPRSVEHTVKSEERSFLAVVVRHFLPQQVRYWFEEEPRIPKDHPKEPANNVTNFSGQIQWW